MRHTEKTLPKSIECRRTIKVLYLHGFIEAIRATFIQVSTENNREREREKDKER